MGGMPAGDPGQSVHEAEEWILGHDPHFKGDQGVFLLRGKSPDPPTGMEALKVGDPNLLHRGHDSNFPARPDAGYGGKREAVADPFSALVRQLRGPESGVKLPGPPQWIVFKGEDSLVHAGSGAGDQPAFGGMDDGHGFQGCDANDALGPKPPHPNPLPQGEREQLPLPRGVMGSHVHEAGKHSAPSI